VLQLAETYTASQPSATRVLPGEVVDVDDVGPEQEMVRLAPAGTRRAGSSRRVSGNVVVAVRRRVATGQRLQFGVEFCTKSPLRHRS
jgi:hypothetical protein